MKANINILLLFYWLLVLPFDGVSQKPYFSKNNALDLSESSLLVRISVHDESGINNEIDRLLTRLSGFGYFNSRIDSVISDSPDKSIIYFSKGLRSRFNQITDNNGILLCTHLEGSYYDSVYLKQCLDTELTQLINKGFPFASVSIDEIDHNLQFGVNVKLEIDPGVQVIITGIEFTGNINMFEEKLIDITEWNNHKLFSPYLIDKSISQLRKSIFVSDAYYSGLKMGDSTYSLVFAVSEIRNSNIDVLLGLEPKVDGGYEVIGRGSLKLNHLFVKASRVEIDFNKASSTENELSLNYEQYSISHLPIGLGIGFQLSQIDSTYQTVSSNILTKLSYSSDKIFWSDLHYNRITATDSYQLNNQPNQVKYGVRVGFDYDTRNSWLNATAGTSLKTGVFIGHAKTQDNFNAEKLSAGYFINSLQVSIIHFLPTRYRIIIVPSLHLYHSIQNRYYDSDRIRFGGTNSMRGFRENQFRLAGYSFSTLESRWMLNTHSYIFSFGSAAYLWEPDELGTKNFDFRYQSVYSAGIGISYRVRPGIFNISYALSNDDSWLNGKIHFRLSNSF